MISWLRLLATISMGVSLLLRVLRRLPYPFVERFLVIASIGHVVVRPSRLRQARTWATAHERGAARRGRLALALLANRGRFLAVSGLLAFMDPDAVRRRIRIERAHLLRGADHSCGKIFLTFHLGPPVGLLTVGLAGHDFVAGGGRLASASWSPPRRSWAQMLILLRSVGYAEKGIALDRLRRLLMGGTTVNLTADGSGRELFRIGVPGGEIVIRAGWWFLRRLTGAETIPILAHRDRSGLVAVVHPPLPPSLPDAIEDAHMCEAVLAPLIRRYVETFPDQCIMAAFCRG